MFLTKTLFAWIMLLFLSINFTGNYSFAQTKVMRAIQYNQITQFETNQSIGNVKISADGSKIVFATGGAEKKIFTINADGTGLAHIYTFPTTGHTPHIDIDAKGERIIWCDWVGEGEIFTSNSDGSVQNKIITLLPNPNPILADMKPNIKNPPRITADGGTVYFIHNHADTFADGIWSVRTDGTNLKQVFNFVELARKAFDDDLSTLTEPWSGYLSKFDISANADKIYVGTNFFKIRNGDIDRGNLSVYANGTYYRLGEYAVGTQPFATNKEGGECIVFRREFNSTLEHDEINVYFDTPGTGDPIRIISGLNIFGTPKMVQMTGTTGAVVLADNGRLPITFVERVTQDRLDLVSIDEVSIRALGGFRFSHSDNPSINWNGDRFCFLTSTAPVPQIWVADIGSDAVYAHPSISLVNFDPDFVLIDGSTSSTFKAHVNSPPFDISAVTFDTFKDGAYHFRALISQWPSWGLLLDNGEFGDENAGDGIFTNNTIGRDLPETPTGNYTIRIAAINSTLRQISMVDAGPFYILNQPSSVDIKNDMKINFRLDQNYPNPFNHQTIISYQLSVTGHVLLEVYDVLGRKVETLINKKHGPGSYEMTFNADGLASGVYFTRLVVNDITNSLKPIYIDSKKILLNK